eukprot:Amastigsp_a509458_622.p2 type:complete len:131 gc:universal Amastigsp_a509458_622:433-41(-)
MSFRTGYCWAVTILGARNLLASDVTGLADPYVLLHWSTGDEGRTHTERFSLNPSFGERFETRVQQHYVIFEVYDKDTCTTDDFMGEFKLKLEDSLPDVHEDWYKLVERVGETRGVTGELHLRVEKIPIMA